MYRAAREKHCRHRRSVASTGTARALLGFDLNRNCVDTSG
nr:MAG TPA: hypothetical protein [Caudoviricetes sp.]